jgi:hypothetical protein
MATPIEFGNPEKVSRGPPRIFSARVAMVNPSTGAARRGRKYPPGLTKTRSGSLSSRLAELKHTWVIRRETMWLSEIGWRAPPVSTPIILRKREPDMRKFHSIAALCGDGLRPELQALFDRLAIDPHSELFMRADGMLQSGPDPKSDTAQASPAPKRAA